jgi:chaperonin GroES
MKFRPLHDRVVVRRIDAEEKTSGGIIIPDTAKEKPMEGEIIAVGPGARNEQGQLVAPDVKAGDRVLVRRIEQEEKTQGGIIIPDTAKEKPMEGEVIAAGPGARGDDGKLNPLDVKVGDRVLFGKWSGTEIKIDGEDLVVMKESDIMGIVA